MASVPIYSAYASRPQYFDAVKGELFYGPRPPVDLPPASDDAYYVTREGDRLSKIAFDAWGAPQLWWLVADLNDLVDPFLVPVGTRLRLPSRARVELEVFG
jgi:hypothetical protein